MAFSASSCTDDLDLAPKYDVTSANLYNDFANYKLVLAKLYGGYALTGLQGPSGAPDVTGFDEGKSNYIRAYWQLQELTTDEAVVAWNDGTIFDLHDMDWSSSNEYIRMMYDRIYYQIALTNEFLRETTDAKLSERGVAEANLAEAKKYRAEARFLRALSYYHALDLFGNVPFVTEQDKVGAFFPNQIKRADLFNFIESELKAIESELAGPKQNEYARADQAAAWMLLAKMYLNSEVYTGQAKYTEAVTYSKKVINSGYSLQQNYRHLFWADNNTSPEIIFPIAFDGTRTKTWGGTTFLINASIGGNMNNADFGVKEKWGGIRTTKNIVNVFADPSGNTDKRAQFHRDGQKLEIESIGSFTDGYAVTKYRNIKSTGGAGSDPAGVHPDTDYPMFRLADAHLMFAEAVVRGGAGGTMAEALTYVNALRQRAYGNTSGNISASQLNLNFILDERARELHWEGHRRTDLIRFGRFTSGTYVWPWKGGVKEGRGVEEYRRLFPIPSFDLTVNPNLVQNPGY
ncbi:outer membrane protein [Rufibacter glacialis]|nr:outer membrane protein [Rufibacter glacialis]